MRGAEVVSEVFVGGGVGGEGEKGGLPLNMEGEGVSGVERRRRRRGEGMVGGMVVGVGGGVVVEVEWWLGNVCEGVKGC